ncbi:MAG: Hydrogenase expression/formation protein HypD [Candidatus Moranbacteria bacterium GW2011_GWF2_36_839]|nr:MAG: Hydrogenase expression/formation protein HypD [Candidatus Moranbacteria bacterium GW2011_GWF1_36_78]KKQ16502.1 MAG: Hydrogenase expression/formation protein HypD [Candidatus Moranbacteria bacterium GW2011_GWF2_36_839]HAT74069.1 hydrogenase formation protein HypD [Candidatus Moranbacteria bacterium]HBY10722.1 hydrogenase formation protein HypD [Candidatus Moranbacteria bacterium]
MEYKKLVQNIQKKEEKINRPLRFMELCGTHSEVIAKYGIKSILPENIKLITGPGCPVCVTDQSEIDIVTGLALTGIPIACYGDATNIPGSLGSLENARQKGAQVHIVYDVIEALKLSRKISNLVFWGIGFETTTVMTAWGIQEGLAVFSSHKLFPPAMEALMANNKIRVDGFINPGHVSAIIGAEVYEKFQIPQVIAGFGAEDVLLAIEMLLDQIISGEKKVENEYTRLVKKEGNQKAQKIISEIFEIRNASWRGLGEIEKSGLKIRKKYQHLNAEFIHRDLITKIKKEIKPKKNACRCGEVLQGLIESKQCKLFGKSCTPDNPQGACMVSREGSCNINFRFTE